MKNLIPFLILAVFAFSCDFNDDPEPRTGDQKWILAGYQDGRVPNPSYITIQDSSYTYALASDGTFRKSIGKQGIGGTYEERFEDGLRKFIFQFEDPDSALIHSCTNGRETYFLNSKGQLTGTWDACEGNKLYFNRQ